MEIKVGFEIAHTAVQPTPMVIMLSIHPSRYSDIIGTESIVAEPNVPIGFYRDSFGNVCGRLVAPAGGVTLRGSALVRDSGLPDVVVPTAQQLPIDQLPDDLLFYLMASRYCETDKLTDIAWSLFGNTQPGWARVAAICTYVHNHVTFGYEHANYMKSAHDVYEQGAGVCRDFAHLALTFCRCMGIPARYCTGYMGDIGIPPDPAPMDFSGWFEVYLSGQWYTCDARHNHPRIGRILMGTGRDAADVALTTSFGRMDLVKLTRSWRLKAFRRSWGMMLDRLFVYGTLMRGFDHPMAQLLSRGADLIGEARCRGRLYLVTHYPALVLSGDPADVVFGELYRLRAPDELLREFDMYEACGEGFAAPTEYVRQMLSVTLEGGATEAWTYVYNWPVAHLARIASGRFLAR